MAMGNEIVGRPGVDPTQGGSNNQQQQLRPMTPVEQTVSLLGAPSQMTDEGIPVYDYSSLTGKYDDDYLSWLKVKAMNSSSDISFTIPHKDEFIASQFKQNNVDPSIDRVPLVMNGEEVKDLQGNPVMVKNPQIQSVYNNASKQYDEMYNSIVNFSEKTFKMLNNEEHFNQLNSIFTKDLGGDKYIRNQAAEKNTGQITFSKKEYTGLTPEEEAAEKSYIFNAETGQYEDYGFWDAVKRRTLNTLQLAGSLNPINAVWSSVANTVEALTGSEVGHAAKWLMPGYSSSKAFEAILPENTMLTVDYDTEQDSYYLTKRKATDRSVTSGQIYGVFGKGSNDNFFGAMAGGFYNMVNPTIMAARFSSLTSQWSMDAMDLVLDDKDKNFYTEEYAKSIAAQNYAVGASYTPSVNASENMFSLEAWGGHIGNAIGILAMMALTRGASSLTAGSKVIQGMANSSNFLLRAGGNIAKYAPTTGLLSISETSSLNQELNDNGVSRELAVGMLPAYFGMTMAIESFGANIMLKETKLGSKVFVKEILNNSIGVNKSSSAGRFMRNVWLGRPENWIQGYTTQFFEEGIEEGMQQMGENIFKATSDYAMMNETFRDRTEQKYLYENGLLPVGEVTTFFDAKNSDSYFDILKDNLWKGVGDAAIIGAVSSVPMSMTRSLTGIVKKQSPSMYYENTRQKTIQNAVINGQDEDLYKEATVMHGRGRLGSTVLDVEGKPRPSDKEQAANWMSENDFLYKQILGEIEIARTIKNSIPESQLNLLDNNMTLVSDFMALKGKMNKINTEINSLMIQEEQEKVDNKEAIDKLQQDLKDLQQDYSDYTTAEPGSEYSKKYNDVLFDIKLRYVYARSLASEMYAKKTNKNVSDLTQKDYASSLYSTMFMHAKNSSDRLVADRSVTATRNSEALLESHKKSINEMYAKKSESTVTDMEGLLSELTGIEMGSYENMDDKVNAIISSMSKIDAIRSNYGVVQKASESTLEGEVSDQVKFDDVFKKVQESIGKLNQSLGELAPRDLTGQEDVIDIGEDENLISPKAPKVEKVMRMEDNPEDLAYQKRQSISAASDFYTSEDFSLMDDTDNKVEELSLEHQARYFNSMDYLLNDAEEKSRAGVNNSGLDVDTFIATVDAMRRNVNLGHKMAMYDHFANEQFFEDSGASKYKRDVDYTLSREDLEKVGVKTLEYNNRINNILQKVYGEKGVGDHNIISSLHARVQVNFYRDMYTKGMQIDEKPVNDAGTISGFLKINLGNEKFNTFKNLLLAVIRQDQVGEKKRGRFDYTKTDITSPVYEENGNKRGILSDDGLRLTEELQSKIFQLEDFIKANKDVFFSEEALYLQISSLNGVMHGFDGETFLNVDSPQTVLRQAVATEVGYLNSSFENIKHGINSIDLLKASAIIDNMSGEGSLIKNHGDIHGAVEIPGKIMEDGTRYVDAESVNSFNYKWAVNYLTFLAGSDTHTMYSDQLKRLEYSKDNAQHVPTTFEQMLAVGQCGSFFNGGNKVLNDILNAEKKYFINRHNEIGAKLRERNRTDIEEEHHVISAVEKSRYRYVENHFMITGDLAAGKTEILKYSLDAALKDDIAKGEVSITIVANTKDLYLKNKALVESYFADKHPKVKLQVNQEFVDTRDIIKNENKLSSFVIIDESGLMGDKFFNNEGGSDLRDLFKVGGRRLLTIGDEFQVTDITRNDVAASTKAGMVSIPLTERFRSGLAITNTLADFFRSMIAQKKNSFTEMAIDDLKMPNVFHKVNENGTKLGVEYNSSPKDIVNNFISDQANVSKVLIIPNTEYLARPEFEQIRVRKADGKYDVDPKYKNNVRIIVDNLYEPAQDISSIQGLEAEHVYIAFDYIDLIKNYISSQSNWKVSPKSMYTAVGRVADKGNNANYVNCIGNPKAKASEDVLTKLQKNKGRNIENEIVLLQNIVGKQTRIVKDAKPATTTDTIDSDTYDIFIEDGYYYTGKSTDKKKLYYASKPKGSLFTNRITYENGKITERVTDYEIEALQNGKPTTKYAVRFTYGLDDNGNQGQLKSGIISEVTTDKNGNDRYKSLGEFGNLKQVIETLNGKNNSNKKIQEVFGKNKDLKQAKFRVNNLFIKDSLWKNVVTGNAHIAVIDYLKNNKNVKVVVYHETPANGKAMITNEGDKFYISYMDMFKEVREEITYDEATAYVNGTFMRKEEDLFQGNLILGAVQEPMSQLPTESQNPVPEGAQVYEETNMLNLGDYAAVIGEAIEIDNKEYLITGIEAPTNAESNMHLITVTDANGDSMTITSQQFKNYSNAVKSNNQELEVPNEERKEQKKANKTRTEMVNSGKMSLPIYFYGRAIADSPAMRNIPEADRMAVSYLIQNLKQKLVRLSYGYSNKAVYVKKGHSYLSDENGFVSDGNMVIVLKGQVNANVDTLVDELKQGDLYNQYKDAIMESLETISVSEPLGLENINVGDSNYIKEQYQQKFNEEGDASSSVFSTFLDKYYNIIKEYNDSDNQEPLMLGNVNTVLVNKNHALDINQTGNTIVTKNGPAFIADMKARGFAVVKIITDHTVGMKQFKNKLAYVFKSAYGTVSTVFATPKYVKNVEGFVPAMIEELKTIRKKKGSDRMSALNQSRLFQMVMQNWSEIKNNSTFWSNHLELVTNNGLPRININKNAFLTDENGKKRKIEEAESLAIDNIIKVISEQKVISDMGGLRVPIVYSRAADNSVEVDANLVDFNAQGINATGMYVDFNTLAFNENATVTPQENKANDPKSKMRNYVNSKKMSKSTADNGAQMHIEEGKAYIRRVLGNVDEILEVVGENTIFTDEGAAYGLYQLGKIKAEASNEGYMNPYVLRHETGHFVLANMNPQKRARTLLAGRVEMVRTGSFSEEVVMSMDDNQVEEWIVTQYQYYGTDKYTYGYSSNATFASKVLNKFKAFVNKIFSDVFTDTYLSDLFNAIENGDFNGMNITDTKADPMFMPKEEGDSIDMDQEVAEVNKDSKELIDNREAFMKDVNYSSRIKSDIIDFVRTSIAEDSYVNPNGSKTLEQSASDFVSDQKEYDFSNDDITINGKTMKLKEVTPDMVQSLEGDNLIDFMTHMANKHVDYIIGELYGNKNAVNAWMHYNETSESRDITTTMSGMFDFVLSIIKTKNGKSVDPNTVKMLIKDNATEITKRANSGTNVSIIDAMIADFNSKASQDMKSVDYRNNLAAIASFVAEHKNIIESMRDGSMAFDYDRYMASASILNKIGSTIVSTWNKNGNEYYYENGELKVKRLTSNRLSRIVNDIRNRVASATMSGKLVSDKLFNALKGSNEDTKYNNKTIGKTIDISSDGVYAVVGLDNVKLIEKVTLKSGQSVFQFTEQGKNTYINKSKQLFTLLGLSKKESHKLNKYITRSNNQFDVLQDKIANYNNDQREAQIIAEGIYYMMASANQWANYQQKLYELSLIESDIDNYDERKAELDAILEKGEFAGVTNLKQDIDAFFVKLKSNIIEMDSSKESVDQNVIAEEAADTDNQNHVNFYKPSDFYQFFDIIADLEVSDDSRGASAVLYDNLGNRIPAYGISNMLTEVANTGMVKNEMVEGKLYKNVEGQLVAVHPLLNQTIGFVVRSFEKVFSYSDKSATKKPKISDRVRVGVDNFVKVMIESAGKTIKMSVFDMSTREDEYSYDLVTNKPLFTFSKVGEAFKVFFHKDIIASKFENGLKYYFNAAHHSAKKLNTILAKYGHGKLVDSYFSGSFNSKGKEYQNMVSELNMVLKKSAGKDTQLRRDIFANLIKDVDYVVDKDGTISVGRAISFNSHSLWNYNMYEKMVKAKDADAKFNVVLDNIKDAYISFTKTLSKSGYRINENYKNPIGYNYEGNHHYYEEKNSGIEAYNPIMLSFFLADISHRTFLDSLTVGDFNLFGTDGKKAKRKAITSSSSLKSYVEKGKLNISRFNVMLVDSSRESITVNGEKLNPLSNDGFSRGTLVGKFITELSLGGQFSGEDGHGKKTLLVDQDIENGTVKSIKHAVEFAGNESYNNSDVVRSLERLVMLDWGDNVNKEFARRGIDNGFSPYAEFIKELKGNKNLGAENAMKRVIEGIITNYNETEIQIIFDNAILQVSDISAAKNEITGFAPYSVSNATDIDAIEDAYTEVDENDNAWLTLPKMSFSVEGSRFVTNLTQDVTNLEENVAAPHQLLSITAQLDYDGKDFSGTVDKAIGVIRESRASKLAENMNGTDAANKFMKPSGKSKVINYIREIAKKSVDNVRGMSNLSNIINDINIDLRIPLINEDTKRMFRGHVNSAVNKIKMNGLRATLFPSNDRAMYSADGGLSYYTMEDIENIFKVDMDGYLGEKEIVIGDRTFVLSRPKAMYWNENGEMQKTEGILVNPLLKQMDMLPTESLKSIYTFIFGDNKIGEKSVVDLQGKTVNEITDALLPIIMGAVTGKNSGIQGFQNNIDKYDQHVYYRNNKDLLMRAVSEFDRNGEVSAKTEAEIKKSIKSFYSQWEKTLTYIDVRIPTGHLGQTNIGRIVAFTSTGNNAYLPGSLGVRNDTDFDGDQNQFYFYSVGEDLTIEQIQTNIILDAFVAAYSDKNNQSKIDRSSNVDDIREMIGDKDSSNPMSTYGAMVENAMKAKSGANAISVFANLISAHGEIFKSGKNNPFTNVKFKGDNNIFRNLGNWLQIALDSANNVGIGELGISNVAIPMFSMALVKFNSKINSADSLNRSVIHFFKNKRVQSILNKVEAQQGIDNYYSHNKLLTTIHNEYNEARIAADGIKKVDYDKAIKGYRDSVAKIKSLNAELGKIFKDKGLNDLWKVVNNKDLFEGLVSKSEEITSLMDSYNDDAKTQEEKDNNAEILSNFSDTLKEMFDDIDQLDEKAIKRLTTNADADIVKVAEKILSIKEQKNELYEKINGKKEGDTKTDGYLDIIKKYNDNIVLKRMYDLAILGEQTRRYAEINSIRNDIPNKSDERYAYVTKVEMYLGMSIKDFLDGKETTTSKFLNWNKKHNRNFQLSANEEEMKTMLRIEEDIYKSFNLPKMLRESGFSKHSSVLNSLSNEYVIAESPMIEDHPVIKEAFEHYASYLFAMPTKLQKVVFDKTVKSYILNAYYRLKGLTISLPSYAYDTSNGFRFAENLAPSLKNLKLWVANDVQNFISNVPLVLEFYRTAASNETVIDESGKNDPQLQEILEAFKTNKFLQAYTIDGKDNAKRMVIDGNMIMSDEKKETMRNEFAKLPEYLQSLIFHYESLRNAYTFKSGSAYDMLPKELFYDQSNYMDKIVDELDAISDNKLAKEAFKKNFVDNVIKDSDALNFKPSEDKKDEFGKETVGKMTKLKSSAVVGMKVSPGDGSNKKGYSSLYYYNFNKLKLKVNSDNKRMTATSASQIFDNDYDHDKISQSVILRSFDTELVRRLADDYVEGKSVVYERTYAEKKFFDPTIIYYTSVGTPIKVEKVDDNGTTFRIFAYDGKTKAKYSNVLNSPIAEQMSVRTDTNQSDIVRIVVDKFSKILPGVPVIVETKETAMQKTGRYDRKGWVDKSGFHFVKENVTADTMVHEFTELWLEHLKTNEYEKYVQLMKLAKNDMKNNPEIVAAIQQSYGLTGNALVTEYMATVSGFNAVDAVETFISKKYGPKTAKNKAGGIFNSIANFISKFWETIKSLFTRLSKTEESTLNSMDFSKATFRDVLNAISDDVMNERSVFSFDEGVELMQLMEDDEVHYSNVLKEVSNIDDFDNVFSRDALGINDRSNISKAEFFYGKIRENKKTGEYYIFYNNKKYNIDKGSKADILKQIELKVLPAVEYGINQRYDALDIILKESKDEKEFTDKAYDMVEATDNKWNFASLKKIFNMSGLSLGYEKVIRYSDLKYSDDPSLRMLYDEYTFGKLDPYIIIHGKGPNGKTNISIMELTSDNLLGANSNLADKNLLAAFGVTDANFFNQGGSMRNNVMGIKQFKLTLLSANIMRTNPDVQINNVSIFGNPTQQMTKSVINNIDSALFNLKAAGANKNVLGMISNEYIKTLLTDEKLLSQKHVGTYLEMLAQYVDPETNLGKLTTNAVNFIRDRRFNEIPRTDIINAIKTRMRIIEKMKAEWSERLNDKEYELLGQTLLQLELRIKRDTIELSDGKDMIKMERWLTTYHNVKNPLAQTFVLAYRKAKTALLNTMKTHFKELNSARNAYFNKYAKENPLAFTTSKMFEASSEVFKKLYQEVNVWRTVNGQRQLVKTHVPFLLHYDINNEATRRALANGEIDMTVVEYGAKIKQQLEAEMIKNIMYDSEADGNPISETRAKVIYLSMLNKYDTSKMYGEFVMPIIKKSNAEMMFKGIKNMATKEGWQSIGDGITKTLDEAGNDYNLFIDVSTENNANDITNEFNKQIGSFDEVMNIAGMKMNSDGTLEIIDERAFNNISTNVEMASASFTLANTRKRIFKTMLTPVYNTTRLLMMKQGINNKDKSLDNTIAWLDDAYKTLVLREAVDMEGSKTHKILVKSIKYVQRLYSNVTLGFSTKLGVKSFGLLKLTEAVDAMAYKMANVGVPQDHIDKYTKILDPKNLAKAEAFMIANWSFGWTLARKLQVIDSQEFDLIHNPVYTKTSQNLASDNVAHILNSGGDNATRAVMVISHLISNGSLEAYSFDKVTGNITYDETKDRKFYDENGKLKNTLLKDVVFQDNVDVGMQDPNNQKLMLGESYKDMDMVKNTTDRWVIGSMTEDARWQINNVVWGRLFTQFRLFSDERLFKAGIFGATRETMIGTGYEFVTDEYGNEIPYVEVKQIEGALQSWAAAFKEVIEYKSMSHFATFWKESSQERRMNIMRSMIKVSVAAILFITFKAMLPDDEEGDAYRQGLSYRHYFNFLYRDMFDLMVIGETLRDPIPMINFVDDVYSVLFNDAEWDKLLKVSGFYRGTVGMTEDIIDVSTKSLEEIAQEKKDLKNE